MLCDFELVKTLTEQYGSPLYVFDEKGFEENYRHLCRAMRAHYPDYLPAYSLKTNYTPYIVAAVKRLGGYAEVVSGMEYYIARRVGFPDERIIFNGPHKGEDGIAAFLNGCLLNVDSLGEAAILANTARQHPERRFRVGLRINADVGQSFISRFGVDPGDIPTVLQTIGTADNLKLVGLHCHVSRCRGIDAWEKRAERMLALADRYFDAPPEFIDLGSGMFGSMDPEFRAQFTDVPSYEAYAAAVAESFRSHYDGCSVRPQLITEPGTTLINKYVDFIGRVEAIKQLRGKSIAVLNCSTHNLGETCTLKELPMRILPIGKQQSYEDLDLTGYTCLEQDVMRSHYSGELAVGDLVIFGNVGGYSNVLKPPFILPNCPMIAMTADGGTRIIKNRESYDDVLQTYVF